MNVNLPINQTNSVHYFSILFLLISLLAIPEKSISQDVGCDCREVIYLNEPSSGSVHKYDILPDGTLDEINPTGPW